VSERDVADAACPISRSRLLKGEREIELHLVGNPEAPLVSDVVFDAGRTAGVDRGGDHGLVFRKRFLGEKSARQVQLSARPAVDAEAAQIFYGLVDLGPGQSLGEGWHDLGKAPRRAAAVDDRLPVQSGLTRGLAAVGEIGQWSVEPDGRARRS